METIENPTVEDFGRLLGQRVEVTYGPDAEPSTYTVRGVADDGSVDLEAEGEVYPTRVGSVTSVRAVETASPTSTEEVLIFGVQVGRISPDDPKRTREQWQAIAYEHMVAARLSAEACGLDLAWWHAEDDRTDGSDCDSAAFVEVGSQSDAQRTLIDLGYSGQQNAAIAQRGSNRPTAVGAAVFALLGEAVDVTLKGGERLERVTPEVIYPAGDGQHGYVVDFSQRDTDRAVYVEDVVSITRSAW